jgi:tetratricopeptide (TPR) repeat protein
MILRVGAAAAAAIAVAGAVAAAGAEPPPGADHFAAGKSLYEAGRFEDAVPHFEDAVRKAPRNSRYQHWLGRAYGRSAERAAWYRALPLARRTLRQFRLAVELDPYNRDAWQDLREYYRQAPGFLGGSARKAREIDARLDAAARASP